MESLVYGQTVGAKKRAELIDWILIFSLCTVCVCFFGMSWAPSPTETSSLFTLHSSLFTLFAPPLPQNCMFHRRGEEIACNLFAACRLPLGRPPLCAICVCFFGSSEDVDPYKWLFNSALCILHSALYPLCTLHSAFFILHSIRSSLPFPLDIFLFFWYYNGRKSFWENFKKSVTFGTKGRDI